MVSPGYSILPPMINLIKFTFLEINLISAQNLVPATKSNTPQTTAIQTYVLVYIDPKRKLSSRIDYAGNGNPTWNDKFTFVIDSDVSPNTCLVFEIYQVRQSHFRKDRRIGVVNALLQDLMPVDVNGEDDDVDDCGSINIKFRAFHVRNPKEILQAILNVGVASLNGIFHGNTPKFMGFATALDYKKLTGGTW